jgi:hypothetical protein
MSTILFKVATIVEKYYHYEFAKENVGGNCEHQELFLQLVGQNRNLGTVRPEDTRRRPRGMSGRSLGVARLKTAAWPVGVSRERKARE